MDQYRAPIAICEKCNKPIYKSEDLVQKRGGKIRHIYCKSCYDQMVKAREQELIEKRKKNRRKSYIFGILGFILILVTSIASAIIYKDWTVFAGGLAIGIIYYPFLGCCLLDNNFIGEFSLSVLSFFFVKMPGVIFGFSIGGLISFIFIKLFLGILQFFIAIFGAIVTFFVCGFISIFVYPFALYKSYKEEKRGENS